MKESMSNQWDYIKWINRGGNLLEIDPYIAKRFISHGLKLCPNQAIGWFNLALSLHEQKKICSSIKAYKHSLSLKGSPYEEAINNLSQDLLLVGKFKEGWELYEKRLDKPKYDNTYFEMLAGKPWEGFKDNRPCKKLVLVAEQGFGDTLQFVRFAIYLQNQGIPITLFCQPALISYLQESTNLNNVTDQIADEGIDTETRWCPLMSLPRILKINKNNICYTSKYLNSNIKRQMKWKKTIKRKANKKLIGLHWQGNLKHENSIYSRGRSTNLKDWLPLLKLKDAEYLILQKGNAQNQIAELNSFPLVSGTEEFMKSMDFRDTAAAIDLCDLVVSADSGIVHLSGALGIKTMVALKWIPEWRWGLEGKQSSWYNSISLYRQTKHNNWEEAIEEIADEISKLK